MRRVLTAMFGLLGAAAISAASADTLAAHEMKGTVVNTDTVRSTITLDLDDGLRTTAFVEGEDAVKLLSRLPAGEKVAVTCKQDAASKCASVTDIRRNGETNPPPKD